MFDKFGEFNSAEEINKAAAAQFNGMLAEAMCSKSRLCT